MKRILSIALLCIASLAQSMEDDRPSRKRDREETQDISKQPDQKKQKLSKEEQKQLTRQLIAAIANLDLEKVHQALESGADRSSFGIELAQSPICLALRLSNDLPQLVSSYLDLAQLLVNQGAHISTTEIEDAVTYGPPISFMIELINHGGQF